MTSTPKSGAPKWTNALRTKIPARQLEAWQLLAEGHSTRVIAQKMHIEWRGVFKHFDNIYARLNLPNDDLTHRRVVAANYYHKHLGGNIDHFNNDVEAGIRSN